MHTPRGETWAQAVPRYLQSARGKTTGTYAAGQLRAQNGDAMGWTPIGGLDAIHELRLLFECWSRPLELAPLTCCRAAPMIDETIPLELK